MKICNGEVICLFRQSGFILKIRLLVIKCENASFDVSLKNILGSGNVIIKVVMRKVTVVRISEVPLYVKNQRNTEKIHYYYVLFLFYSILFPFLLVFVL
jgi:hypothetical protein